MDFIENKKNLRKPYSPKLYVHEGFPSRKLYCIVDSFYVHIYEGTNTLSWVNVFWDF